MKFEEQPQFIKEFSKSESPEERNRLAQEIREKRKFAFLEDNEQFEKKEVNSIINETENLRDNIEIYNNDESFHGKIDDFFEVKKIKSQLEGNSGISSTFEEQLKQPTGGRQEFEETRKRLFDFYNKEKQKWSEKPYTKEDISKYFDEENLKSLSVDDYALLLKRFPGNMVTHVTRQGVRDHFCIDNHNQGLGEFHNNFKNILEKKQLHSAIGIELQQSSKEKLVSDYLDQFIKDMETAGYAPDREGACSRIESKLGYGALKGSPYNFADRSAIHVATEQVADAIYGGERGNEVFFAFPSAFVASQMKFGGQLKENIAGSHNDQRIWANLEKGMNLDAGLVFIPEEVEVGAKTGSKYELDDNNNPVIIEGNVIEIRKLTDSANFSEFADQALKILGKNEIHQRQEDLEQLRKTLEEKFSIKDRAIQDTALNYKFLHEIKYAAYEADDDYRKMKVDKEIKQVLMDKENLYLKAKDTVKSREYWENYFAQNPQKRPSKIIYYKGSDPTAVLNEWREQKGILKRTEKADIDFEENKKTDKEINEDIEQSRFMSIAKKIIEDRFPAKKEKKLDLPSNEEKPNLNKGGPPPLDEDEPPLVS
ncbi:MAG: hypothetical protein COU46_02600 [Candidatus Niyogibacteria bacterium CG10_big_fil_rev_8_21_14_0_10_42_19]|uniref:Uncharacterized protein n=1 Tax=Candidatus Niyogibacteria bacterium CG10_big_fil_rev_8_21_14_0_10_42_19 TaxID=1974725 RepID=A0A2H0TF99_9BACT|nr:MAG: hypothetical protein COU46_02600 [Candidatus Niyogibacteria bacterium CG10_big_fil_rev_8_21_14_0_10_42_19]